MQKNPDLVRPLLTSSDTNEVPVEGKSLADKPNNHETCRWLVDSPGVTMKYSVRPGVMARNRVSPSRINSVTRLA